MRVINGQSGNLEAVVKQSSGSHQEFIRQSAERQDAVIGQSLNFHNFLRDKLVVIHSTAYETESLFSLVYHIFVLPFYVSFADSFLMQYNFTKNPN